MTYYLTGIKMDSMKKQLVDKKIKEVIDMRKKGYSLAEIGFYFGVSRQRISQLISEKLNKGRI